MWCPPVISWFIYPMKTIDISIINIINHSCWSYVHQLSYLGGPTLYHVAINHVLFTTTHGTCSYHWCVWGLIWMTPGYRLQSVHEESNPRSWCPSQGVGGRNSNWQLSSCTYMARGSVRNRTSPAHIPCWLGGWLSPKSIAMTVPAESWTAQGGRTDVVKRILIPIWTAAIPGKRLASDMISTWEPFGRHVYV